ncbi:MAG: hypothetical protein CW338_07935 [Clostridiales bacterium]|nr:hypothetical protein [Clostridiales bacterium]
MKQILKRIISAGIVLCMLLPSTVRAGSEPVTRVRFSGTDAVIDGSGAKLKKDSLTISAGGEYILSGTFAGRVKVDAEGQKVVLVLSGADISGGNRCPLLIKSASSVTLILTGGTVNRLCCEAVEDAEEADEEDEGGDEKGANALKCACPLRIEGGGTLEMTSGKNGISGKESVTVADGTMIISCVNDGIHLSGDNENGAALSVEGGRVSITCGGDGMQAGIISISGGSTDILCGGGSAAAAAHNDGFGGRGGMPWGRRDMNSEEEDETSCKGIKAGSLISVSGGCISINAKDDALHSNDRIIISGGEAALSSGDDGVHADAYLEISGGAVNITESYEGLEARRIEISGGDIQIRADDDGMNASGGSDGSGFGMPGGWGGFGPGNGGRQGNDRNRQRGGMKPGDAAPPEGATPPDDMTPPNGMTPPADMPGAEQPPSGKPKEETDAEDETPLLHISGGNITVDADGDGLDSNGDLIIDGGSILVHGPSNGGNGALDSGMENGGILRISGGTILAYGAADMAESFDESSAQPSLTFTSASRFSAGTAVILTDAEGNVLYQAVLSKTGSSVILSTPDLAAGRTFTLTVGSFTETFTVEDTVTCLGSGRPYSGFGGFRR